MKKIVMLLMILMATLVFTKEERTASETYQDKNGVRFVFDENKNEWAYEKVLILTGEAMIEEEASEDEKRKNLSVSLVLGDDVVTYYFVIKDGKVVSYWEESVPIEEYNPSNKFEK